MRANMAAASPSAIPPPLAPLARRHSSHVSRWHAQKIEPEEYNAKRPSRRSRESRPCPGALEGRRRYCRCNDITRIRRRRRALNGHCRGGTDRRFLWGVRGVIMFVLAGCRVATDEIRADALERRNCPKKIDVDQEKLLLRFWDYGFAFGDRFNAQAHFKYQFETDLKFSVWDEYFSFHSCWTRNTRKR